MAVWWVSNGSVFYFHGPGADAYWTDLVPGYGDSVYQNINLIKQFKPDIVAVLSGPHLLAWISVRWWIFTSNATPR
jgi:ADP-glucose pyrophosphorylase